VNIVVGRFTSVGVLTRLAFRRDRVLLPLWVVGMAATAVATAASTRDLYPTAASRASAAELINSSPVFVALLGRIYDPTSLGALALIKLTSFGGLVMGAIAIAVTLRHTRGEEQAGRWELLGSNDIQRGPDIAAAFVVAMTAVFATGALTAVGLIAVGLPAAGSIVFALEWIAIGAVFTGVALVAAQVSSSAATARQIGLAVLGLSYSLRALGDFTGSVAGPSGWAWVSPLSWVTEMRAFAGNHWWTAIPTVILCLTLTGFAARIRVRRDLGAGLLPQRTSRTSIDRWIAQSWGLPWRLDRTAIGLWLLGYLALGLIYGSFASRIDEFVSNQEAIKGYLIQLGGTESLVDAYNTAEYSIIALLTAALAISLIGHLRTDEEAGRTDLLLIHGMTRVNWASGRLAVTLAVTVVGTLIAGYRDPVAALAYVPAVWVIVGLAMLLFGLRASWISGVWVALVAFVLIAELGPLFKLPEWVTWLSPFSHVPSATGNWSTWGQLVALLCVAGVLTASGLISLQRRDIGG